MKRLLVISAGILLPNLLLASLMYQTVGWYFIRGYNEVVNSAVFTFAIAQVGLNLLIAAPIAVVSRWRRTPGGRMALGCLLLSTVIVLLSPLFAPIIGGVAKRNLWIETPLVEAARYGDTALVITLLNNGADPNAKQPALGTTALHYMAARGELRTVEALLANGADPNARADTSLLTPLHWAIRSRANVAIVNSLMNHGADPELEDSGGKTPRVYTRVIPDPLRAEILRAMESDARGKRAKQFR